MFSIALTATEETDWARALPLFDGVRICVNLAASKAEGAAFGSDLLRLAKVIR